MSSGISKIILHYLGPGSGEQFTAQEAVKTIRGWHQSKGWSDIGYHWVIDQKGGVAPGRSEDLPGAHAFGANSDSIGILCCFGTGDDHLPKPMLDALARLIADRAEEYGIPLDRAHVIGHKDVAGPGGQTACPGALYPLIPKVIENARRSATVSVELDGEPIGEALLVDGQSYLPVRKLAEALGLSVTWEAATKTVRLGSGS